MPRQARAEFDAGVYHVIARGNRRQLIYADPDDRHRYLGHLGRVTLKMRWRTMAYCLMRNHVHLLVETRMPNLGRGVQRLHGLYAQYFNNRHDVVGHLFQGRFKAVPVQTDAQFWLVAAYIANNPVAAGLCRAAAEWPWSSHTALTGGSSPDWLDRQQLHAYFAAQGGDPAQRYADFVAAAARNLKGLSL